MEKSNAEGNWSISAEKAEEKEAFSDSSTKLSDSVNEPCHELDENKNKVKYDITDLAHAHATSSLVPEMENLRLLQQEKEPEHLAGYIKAVIPPIRTLVIQQAPGSKILDVGTTIFTRKINEKNHEEIGFISDIFGSINEPMYALQLKQMVESEFLKLDSEVFYLHGHPSTGFVSVVCDENGRYTIIYS